MQFFFKIEKKNKNKNYKRKMASPTDVNDQI